MAGKVKGLALMGAIALSLTGGRALAADTPQETPTPPATTPESVIQLTEADFERLRELGITTSQAEINAEYQELQADETYGPVDLRGLQRTVDEDVRATMGDGYEQDDDVYTRYMNQLRERYENNAQSPNKVRIIIAESRAQDERVRLRGMGLRYELDF